MKKILFILILLIIIIGVFYQFAPDTHINRQQTFQKCSITYPHYILGRTRLSEGHYVTNENTLFYAHRKLALCLCEEYIRTKDDNIKEKLIELSKRYSSDRNMIEIDSIIENRQRIFDPIMYIE